MHTVYANTHTHALIHLPLLYRPHCRCEAGWWWSQFHARSCWNQPQWYLGYSLWSSFWSTRSTSRLQPAWIPWRGKSLLKYPIVYYGEARYSGLLWYPIVYYSVKMDRLKYTCIIKLPCSLLVSHTGHHWAQFGDSGSPACWPSLVMCSSFSHCVWAVVEFLLEWVESQRRFDRKQDRM